MLLGTEVCAEHRLETEETLRLLYLRYLKSLHFQFVF